MPWVNNVEAGNCSTFWFCPVVYLEIWKGRVHFRCTFSKVSYFSTTVHIKYCYKFFSPPRGREAGSRAVLNMPVFHCSCPNTQFRWQHGFSRLATALYVTWAEHLRLSKCRSWGVGTQDRYNAPQLSMHCCFLDTGASLVSLVLEKVSSIRRTASASAWRRTLSSPTPTTIVSKCLRSPVNLSISSAFQVNCWFSSLHSFWCVSSHFAVSYFAVSRFLGLGLVLEVRVRLRIRGVRIRV